MQSGNEEFSKVGTQSTKIRTLTLFKKIYPWNVFQIHKRRKYYDKFTDYLKL